jgi:hypothetical protein
MGQWLEMEMPPTPTEDYDPLYSWLVHITKVEGVKLLVFMNEASRFVVCVKKPSLELAISEILFKTLQETMLADNINAEVIERYIASCGEYEDFYKISQKQIPLLKIAVIDASVCIELKNESMAASLAASGLLEKPAKEDPNQESFRPANKFYSLLERYDLPIRRGKAFDLTVRLELLGEDAIRKIRVSANMSFLQLHFVLQNAFNWQNFHLHSFRMYDKGTRTYTRRPAVELLMRRRSFLDDLEAELSSKVKLWKYLPRFKKIHYFYDFGDNWHHRITVDQVIENCTDELPMLLSGQGAAPIEDLGGPQGFADFLSIINDPKDKDYEYFRELVEEESWGPFDFDQVAEDVKNSLIL